MDPYAIVNEQMGWSYTKAQLDSIIQRACISTTDICEYVSYTSYDGNLLCGKSTAIQVHYDQLNGGSGIGLPSELTARYPNTMFRFTRRGQAGADVEVIGGTHPSQYQGSTWDPLNMFGDFKPGQPWSPAKFRLEISKGKLPSNTQYLPYNPVTGALQ